MWRGRSRLLCLDSSEAPCSLMKMTLLRSPVAAASAGAPAIIPIDSRLSLPTRSASWRIAGCVESTRW
jgi:hypothetical protein